MKMCRCQVAAPVEKEHNMLSPCEIRQKVGESTKRLSSNVAPNTRHFYVHRKTMSIDYNDFRKKSWVNKDAK